MNESGREPVAVAVAAADDDESSVQPNDFRVVSRPGAGVEVIDGKMSPALREGLDMRGLSLKGAR